ncbi:hypothetical protein [Pelagibacterium sediminicola]|uniref:hypothetical protein n=1 Tax=Pelagibacterium sediminicola TaxID=2248761 RepID=UPI000E31FA9C|nr:hypothetical protein [Pelagibacterium sediminicola]
MIALAIKARALLDAVDFDNNGKMVAGVYRGGNGGLISRETIIAADELRKVLESGDYSPSFDGSNSEQMALAVDFCAEINRASGVTPEGLLDMTKRLYEAGGRI